MAGALTFAAGACIVTGGASGIGKAIAGAFAAAGVPVVITGRNEETLRRACDDLGEDVVFRVSDVDDGDAQADLVADVEANVGPVGYLVNNAGRHLKKPFVETRGEDFDAVVATNLRGVFMLTRACAERMRARRRGAVVMISSMSGLMGLSSVPVYSLTKTGLLGLTRSLASELGADGIRVNAVCPGFIDTPMFRTAVQGDAARLAKITGRIPLQELGDPADIAGACLYLCSDQARYLTGVTLPVDGGFSIGF